MKLPTLPDERGHSKGVRQRVERSFPAIRAAVGFRDVVAEALDRVFGERLTRMVAARVAADGDGGRERYLSFPDFLASTGLDIESKRDAMVQADLALVERRRIRRRACDRRDRLKRKLYDARVKFKKEARKKLGRKRWKNAIMINGETPRDPLELTRQAGLDVTWATEGTAPRLGLAEHPVDWAAMTAPLVPLIDDLEAAVQVVYCEDSDVSQAVVDRIEAIEAFDDRYNKGARTLETTYVLLGLPTLAAAVRPHLKVAGRVGRPSKLPPVDDYPDLVERARAAGLLPMAAERESPAASNETQRLAEWIAAYRQVIVPYLSFLAGLEARTGQTGGSGTAAGLRSAAAWPARWLARWRGRGKS